MHEKVASHGFTDVTAMKVIEMLGRRRREGGINRGLSRV